MLVGHPDGNGVIYYPKDDNDGTPERLLNLYGNGESPKTYHYSKMRNVF